MFHYQNVSTDLWSRPEIQGLTPNGRYLLIYLLTCPECINCGVFIYSDELTQLRTGLKRPQLKTAMGHLEKRGLVTRDKGTGYLLLNAKLAMLSVRAREFALLEIRRLIKQTNLARAAKGILNKVAERQAKVIDLQDYLLQNDA